MREIEELWSLTRGDPQICVAVLDGLVDLAHPCFEGADLRQLSTLVQGQADPQGLMSLHGTHITSIIFCQPDCPAPGIAPYCKGLIVPIFSDERRSLSQLDLSRAINQAIEAGANIINVSGGQLTEGGVADPLLESAVRNCRDNNVLLIAAAGNDGCECLHVPATLSSVLAVGALDQRGNPLAISNWGPVYQSNGILAPGESILGSKPGGGTARMTGTSFATPIVTGVAALLMSLQRARGDPVDAGAVRAALLESASPCDFTETATDGHRCLAGKLNVSGAMQLLTKEHQMPNDLAEKLDSSLTSTPVSSAVAEVAASGCGCQSGVKATADDDDEMVRPQMADGSEPAIEPAVAATITEPAAVNAQRDVRPSHVPTPPDNGNGAPRIARASDNRPLSLNDPPQVTPSSAEPAPGGYVYAFGTLGYDFGTEARRDAFKQLMPVVEYDGVPFSSNPYDARQMADYLGQNPSEARELIWTLNLELTPIYAVRATGEYARDVYEAFQQLLDGQVQAEDADDFIERVSIPGRLTGRSVRLFSGQEVPLVSVENTRGLYGWKVNTLVEDALTAVKGENAEADETAARKSLTQFLNRVYYDLRNLGQTAQERALNFAATNAFQVAATFSEAVGTGMELDDIQVMKSPFCRMDSDCWDVVLSFFDAENLMRARKLFRFTIDVSDVLPVTLGKIRSWSSR